MIGIGFIDDLITAGFDEEGNKIYSTFQFNLSSLPPYNDTMITKAYFELNSTKIYIKDDIRFHLEFVDENINKKMLEQFIMLLENYDIKL